MTVRIGYFHDPTLTSVRPETPGMGTFHFELKNKLN